MSSCIEIPLQNVFDVVFQAPVKHYHRIKSSLNKVHKKIYYSSS